MILDIENMIEDNSEPDLDVGNIEKRLTELENRFYVAEDAIFKDIEKLIKRVLAIEKQISGLIKLYSSRGRKHIQ